MRINGVKFIFVWTSNRLPAYLTHILLYVQHIAPGLAKKSPWPTTLCWRRDSVDLRSRRELGAAGLTVPC